VNSLISDGYPGTVPITTIIAQEVQMRTLTSRLSVLMLLLAIAVPSRGLNSISHNQGIAANDSYAAQKDSVSKAHMTNADYVAKRVDSLQFIVIYNADLLRRDLDSKVVWIYVMLGVMIVASMMMYGALNQAQRQRKELEERVFNSLSSSVADLEAQIKHVEEEIPPSKAHRRTAAPRKKKS
jgi:outer membrane murein-binding lipoprotein Lpp